MTEAESIICIFCGGISNIKEQNNQEVVSCPRCKRDYVSVDSFNRQVINNPYTLFYPNE